MCSGCGQPVHESMDPKNDRAYRVGLPHRCHACTAQQKMMEKYAEQDQASALRFPIEKR